MNSKDKFESFDDGIINFEGSFVPTRLNIDDSKSKIDSMMKKSILVPDLERCSELPMSSKKKKKDDKKEIPEEILTDVKVLQMRSAIDRKRFYKKDKTIGKSGNIQIGQVIDSATDFYSGRLSKKERKKTLVDELMNNLNYIKYNKRHLKGIYAQNPKSKKRSKKRKD